MDKKKADELIFSYIRKIFGFAMSRLSKIDEAEELAAEITFQVYSSLLKQDRIENPDGYVFRIAQNVYAKHIDVKKLTASVDGIEYLPDNDDFTLDILNSESYGILRREITYLSKTQRENNRSALFSRQKGQGNCRTAFLKRKHGQMASDLLTKGVKNRYGKDKNNGNSRHRTDTFY